MDIFPQTVFWPAFWRALWTKAPTRVPRCIALIPDGNRRFAAKHLRPKLWGHTQGLENLQTIARAAFDAGVEHVVVWAASESNLKNRPAAEIMYLVQLLKREIAERLRDPEGTRLYIRGSWRKHIEDAELDLLISNIETGTACFTRRHLTLLFGYSGKTDALEAAKKFFRHASVEGFDDISDDIFDRYSATAHIPNVDLIIRTGVDGTPNESDPFLPFKKQNAVLYFRRMPWPAFTAAHLRSVLKDYGKRSAALRKGA